MSVIRIWVVSLLVLFYAAQSSATPEQLLQDLDAYPHAKRVASDSREVIDYELGLGAIRKVGGAWRFKDSVRLSGTLYTFTWQIIDGFTSREVADEFSDKLPDASLLFECKARSCGPGVQWANRVFQQRVLYGREDQQRYRVYALQGEAQYRVIVYDSARTADRQYLHVEVLRLQDPDSAD